MPLPAVTAEISLLIHRFGLDFNNAGKGAAEASVMPSELVMADVIMLTFDVLIIIHGVKGCSTDQNSTSKCRT